MRAGQRIGPYVVRKVLGSGAMGLVLEVEHPELGNEYALKVVRPDVLGDSDAVKRFQREMEALARVDDHPGLVRIHSAGLTEEGAPYYAMELIRGHSMRDALKRGLPEEDALDAIEQVGRALAHMHARGLVHRDVKPENILIGEDGQARLTDFGLARWLGLQPERVTRTGDLVGTPTHMAPEQAMRTLGEIGPWSDVYGLGVTLYEVFTGRTPYLGKTAIEVYTQLADGAPFDAPGRARPDLDPALEAVCLRALARRPTDRFTDVPSFLAALARARAGGDDAGKAGSRRPGLLLGIAGASLVVAGAALGASWWRSDEQRRSRDEATRALAAEVAQVERHLGRGAVDEAYTEGRDLLAAERGRDGGARGPLEALTRAVEEAARRRTAAAYREGDVARARALLDEAPTSVVEERAWILALVGEPARALEALPATARPADRARIAAWAGDALACGDALARVEPPDRARALAWELGVSASLPALLPSADGALGAGPASGWGLVARGEAALSGGLVPLAAIAFDDALLQASERTDAELEVAAALGLCQVSLARGDLDAAGARAAQALRRCDASVSPLTRARALGWAACVAVAAGATSPELRSVLGGRDAVAAATRAAPGAPLVVAARGEEGSPSAWPALRDARGASGKGDLAGATAAFARVAVDASATLGTIIGLERAACARGHDGAPGLLLARAADLTAAAEAGNDREAATDALPLLEAARRLRPTSPLAWAATSQAHRVRRDAAGALEASRQAWALAPGCAGVLLEEARALALSVEGDALLVDLERAQGRPAPADERELAGRLERVVQAHRDARGAPAIDAATADAARLGAARALVEAAWRRWCDGEDGADEARAAVAAALDAELGPLLARVDVPAIVAAHTALAEAVTTTQPGALDGVVAEAERALARAAWGEPPRSVDLAALEALLLRASPMDEVDHARAFLALAGDLPARALLWARRAERANEDAAVARHQRLAHAAALAPDLPHVALEQELERRGRSAASLLRLARVIARAPELTRAVIDMLAVTPRTLEDERALWEELGQADAPPRERHRARALLLRGTRVFSPGPGAAATADARDAYEREVKARATWHDDASRRAYAEATRALAIDGADGLAPSDAGTRVLRALCCSSLARGAGLGASCDPRALPDALFDARVARAAAPWASAPLLVELDLGPTELAVAAADELIVHGFLTSARERLMGSPRGEAIARRAQPFAHLLQELHLRDGPRTLEIARVLQEGGVAPRLALALRLEPVVSDPKNRDDLGDPSFTALARNALGERADVTAGADSTYWFARARHLRADARRRVSATALAAAIRAVHEGHAGGLGLALQPRQVLAPGVRREAPHVEPADDAVLARNLPAQPSLGEVWTGLSRPERALPLLAQLWADEGDEEDEADEADEGDEEDEAYEEYEEAEDLLSPWSKLRAHLMDLQGPLQDWAVGWWADGGDAGDVLLALDRAVAFRRHVATEEVAYWAIFLHLRWHVVGDPDGDPETRRAAAAMGRAAALRLREVVPSAALRGLAADCALDLAFLDAAGPEAVTRARAEAEAAAPDLVSPSLESGAVAWWRLVRARAAAGDTTAALDALARVKGRVAADDHWGLEWVVTSHDPALPALRAVPEVAAFLKEWRRKRGDE